MQNVQIVQVGDVALHLHIHHWHGQSISARERPSLALDHPGAYLPDVPYQTEAQSIDIKATLFSSGGRTASRAYQELAYHIGRVTDIIAVEPIGCDASSVFACGVAPANTRALWLSTPGRITRLDTDNARGDSFEIGIEVELAGMWTALNPVLWYAGNRDISSTWNNEREGLPLPPTGRDVNPLPMLEDWFGMYARMGFQRRTFADTSFVYDPRYWNALMAYQDTGLPAVRYGIDWQTENDRYTVFIDRGRWSAPAASVYVFRGIDVQENIRIEVRRENGWALEDAAVTFDTLAVSNALAGAGFTLTATDVLVTGDVPGQAFVIRDGVILAHVADAMTITGGGWPGMVLPGTNTIGITGAEHAMYHAFRRV